MSFQSTWLLFWYVATAADRALYHCLESPVVPWLRQPQRVADAASAAATLSPVDRVLPRPCPAHGRGLDDARLCLGWCCDSADRTSPTTVPWLWPRHCMASCSTDKSIGLCHGGVSNGPRTNRMACEGIKRRGRIEKKCQALREPSSRSAINI